MTALHFDVGLHHKHLFFFFLISLVELLKLFFLSAFYLPVTVFHLFFLPLCFAFLAVFFFNYLCFLFCFVFMQLLDTALYAKRPSLRCFRLNYCVIILSFTKRQVSC